MYPTDGQLAAYLTILAARHREEARMTPSPWRNLTPHPVDLHRTDGTMRTVLPEPVAARISETNVVTGEIDGIPTWETRSGEVTGLPDPEPGVAYIVSRPVALAVPDRPDVWAVADFVRDPNGRVIGARAVTQLP